MARNRIIYASQSVWVNGEVLYRVQSLGTTTSFTSEDIFELGHLDIIDVVDDVPSVAVTLNTNDFGDVVTLATLAQVAPAKSAMNVTAIVTNANLVSGASDYLHGVALADFAITCGNLAGVTLWAPVQDECSIGTLTNNIDQTLFLDEVFTNSLEYSYTTGANATENYGAETDNKMWLLNDGRFVNFEETTLTSTDITNGYVDLDLSSSNDIAVLSGGLGFLRKDADGAPAITWYDESENVMENIEIVTGSAAAALTYVYEDTGSQHRIYVPTGADAPAEDDILQFYFAADAYSNVTNTYFTPLTASDTRPDATGAVRQGQVELYILDPDSAATSYENAWRLTGCTISADLTREPLTELGHLGPYDRPLTLPIPITMTIDSTAGDLELWARFSGLLTGFDADTLTDIDLTDLMTKDNLILVVKVYEQTDVEANGTGSGRVVATGSDMVGDEYFDDGTMAVYSGGDAERALKTVIVKNLKITDEGMTLDLGSNATQTFGFKSNNDLFAIKGDVSYAVAKATITRNA